MDLSQLTVFAAVRDKMDWLTKRQEVVAQNIANADTPRYLPKDLKSQSFERYLTSSVASVALSQTSGQHLDPVKRAGEYRAEDQKSTYEATPSGNAVVLEEQLLKVNEIQSGYRLATNLYAKHVGLLKAALGSRGR